MDNKINNNVMSFKQAQLKSNAKIFVDMFEKTGYSGAVDWAKKNVGKENYMSMRPHVQKEFLSRGYEVRPVEEL